MSEIYFRSMSWEQIGGFWPNFACAFILTTFRLGLLCIKFCKFTAELWPLIDVRMSFSLIVLRTNSSEFDQSLYMLWYWQDLVWDCYTSIFANLLQRYDGIFSFNIWRTNWWNFTKFFICIYIGKIEDGIITHLFLQICNRVTHLIDVRILFLLSVLRTNGRVSPNFAYALILTIISRLGLISIIYTEYFNKMNLAN